MWTEPWNVPFFWGILLIGFITLGVQCWNTYGKPVLAYKNSRYPLLQKVELSSLSGRREYALGFIFYVGMIYAVYVFAVIFYDKIQEIQSDVTKIIGPLGGVLQKPTSLYAVPLIVSSGLIAIMSFQQFAGIEGKVRSLAHRFAGIPRGIYGVLTNLSQFDFVEAFESASPGVLRDLTKALIAIPDANIDKNTHKEFAANIVETIDNLRAISVIFPSLVKEERDRIWSQFNIEHISELASKLDEQDGPIATELDKLVKLLAIAPAQRDQAAAESLAQGLSTSTGQFKQDLFSIFSLMYIAERNIQIPINFVAARSVIVHLRRGIPDPLKDSFIGSVLIGGMISMVVTPLLLATLRTVYPVRNTAQFDPKRPCKFDLAESVCRTNMEYLGDLLPQASIDAIIIVGQVITVYIVAVGLSMATRIDWMEVDRWEPWVSIPFNRFASASIIPVAIASLACVVYYYAVYYVKLEANAATSALTIVREFWKLYASLSLLYGLGGFAFCWLLFLVADMHIRLRMMHTILIGIGVTVFYVTTIAYAGAILIAQKITVARNLREDLVLNAAISMALCISFCVLVERSERVAGESKP